MTKFGDGVKFQIPDWRQYKVQGCPELETVQRQLAAKGLKDPWLRNEVWRYQKGNYTPPMTAMCKSLLRGFKWAALAMVVTIAAEKTLGIGGHGADHH